MFGPKWTPFKTALKPSTWEERSANRNRAFCDSIYVPLFLCHLTINTAHFLTSFVTSLLSNTYIIIQREEEKRLEHLFNRSRQWKQSQVPWGLKNGLWKKSNRRLQNAPYRATKSTLQMALLLFTPSRHLGHHVSQSCLDECKKWWCSKTPSRAQMIDEWFQSNRSCRHVKKSRKQKINLRRVTELDPVTEKIRIYENKLKLQQQKIGGGGCIC